MKIFLILLIICIPSLVQGQAKKEEMESLHWLIGKWEGTSGGATLKENWQMTNDLTMTGEGAVIVNGKAVVKENLQIHLMGSHLGYIASPNDAPPTFFSLIEATDRQWVFENKEHDFPQRVIYTRSGEETFEARIEGTNSKGEEGAQVFKYKRAE